MKLFIANLNFNTTETDLVNFFNQYIKDQIDLKCIKIVKDFETKISRGFAYVSFYSKDDFDTVLNLNQPIILNDRHLRISESTR